MEQKNSKYSGPIRVAVASYEGVLVNQHLGLADHLWVFEIDEKGFRQVGRRPTPPAGEGDERWVALSGILNDCSFLLVNAIGQRPVEMLSQSGLQIYEIEGLIEDALMAIYQGKELRMPRRKNTVCRRAATGMAGEGCG